MIAITLFFMLFLTLRNEDLLRHFLCPTKLKTGSPGANSKNIRGYSNFASAKQCPAYVRDHLKTLMFDTTRY